MYRRINGIMPALTRQKEEEGPGDYWVDEKAKQVYLTETAISGSRICCWKPGCCAMARACMTPPIWAYFTT
jgi:hypothetical protein